MEDPFKVVIIFGVVVFFERCSAPEASSSGVIKTSLTTAKVRDSNLIPKPTSYLRRISVEPVKQSSSTPYALGVTGPPRRANTLNMDAVNDVWRWNHWCQFQPKSGNCSATGKGNQVPVPSLNRYYYEVQVDSCKKFLYSGCDGNKNNFETLAECENNCKAVSRLMLEVTNNTIYCAFQPNVGMCFSLIKRYYYDVQTNECKTFIYGGCGGNQNRFDNIERCEKRCKKVKSVKRHNKKRSPPQTIHIAIDT